MHTFRACLAVGVPKPEKLSRTWNAFCNTAKQKASVNCPWSLIRRSSRRKYSVCSCRNLDSFLRHHHSHPQQATKRNLGLYSRQRFRAAGTMQWGPRNILDAKCIIVLHLTRPIIPALSIMTWATERCHTKDAHTSSPLFSSLTSSTPLWWLRCFCRSDSLKTCRHFI